MKTSLDAYRSVLKEIDKHGSPTFTVLDFNYFYQSAVDEKVRDVYGKRFDVTQKSLDDIRVLLNLGQPLSFTGKECDLPSKYRHMLGMEVVLKFLVDIDGFSAGNTITTYPQRMRTNRVGYSSNNAYQRSSYKKPYFQIAKEKITILSGSNTEIESGKMDFIEVPETMFLNPDPTVDFNDPENNTPLQFPEDVNLDIVKRCGRIFLENIESRRYQTSLNEQALRGE